MSIKKPYEEIVKFLTSNENKKVSSILGEIILMCESQKTTSTVIKDSDGNVVSIYCWYHKQWEILKDVPYGAKANSTSGYNTMCKVGVSKWTKSQRHAKDATASLLTQVSKGEVSPSDILKLQSDIEASRNVIDKTDAPVGFASEDEVWIILELLDYAADKMKKLTIKK